MKLGELLVQAGKISPAQLEETLKGQVIFGGKLGTNLVEMGYLNEEELAEFLSRKTGVPRVDSDQLMNISPDVKKILPVETVKKHRVVPVALHNRKLLLAMSNPSDFSAIDEISFLTGYIVTPLVAPELRLLTALEKHYDIRREMRYISVSGSGGRASRRVGVASPAAAERPQLKVAHPAPAQVPRPQLKVVEPAVEELEEILELPELCEYLGDDEQGFGLDLTPHHPPAAAPAKKAGYSLQEVLEGLAEARGRDEIAELLVRHAAQQFETSALFLVKGEKATGWLARRDDHPVLGFDELEIPMREPSVLKTILDQRSFHLGPLPISPANGRIAAALGGQRAHTLLIPLILTGRVVAILYLQGEAMLLGKELPHLQKLVAKASLAFEILILKGKILGA